MSEVKEQEKDCSLRAFTKQVTLKREKIMYKTSFNESIDRVKGYLESLDSHYLDWDPYFGTLREIVLNCSNIKKRSFNPYENASGMSYLGCAQLCYDHVETIEREIVPHVCKIQNSDIRECMFDHLASLSASHIYVYSFTMVIARSGIRYVLRTS